MDDWSLVQRSPTVSDFNTNWNSFEQAHPPALVKYVWDTWINEHKERIVWAWVNRIPHFGHRASSRVEGSHRSVKEYILGSTGDLYITFQSLLRFWNAQHDNWQATLAQARSRLPIFARGLRYNNLIANVSMHALCRIEAKWRIMKDKCSSQHCP